jgi:hypothetical protein
MLAPQICLENHIHTLHLHVAGKFVELVFNLDELCSADREKRTVKKVIATSSVRREDLHHSLSRCHHHMTLLVCLSATGDSFTPMMVTASAIRPWLWSCWVLRDGEAMIRNRTPASLSQPLFCQYLSTVFIPYVTTMRSRSELENEPAVLLMDFPFPRRSDGVGRVSGENNIIAITFPTHTPNLFQAVGLVIFGAVPTLKPRAGGEIDVGSTGAPTAELIHAHQCTATSETIR